MILPLLALGWMFGVVAAGLWHAPPLMAMATVVAAAPIGARWHGSRGALLALAAGMLALIGAWRFAAWNGADPPPLSSFVGQEATLTGVIASEADPGPTTNRYRFDADRISIAGQQYGTSGAVLITVSQYARWQPGDRMTVTGELEQAPSFEGFDWRAWLEQQGIVGTMLYPDISVADIGHNTSITRQIYGIRNRLDTSLQRALPEPEASLAAGIAFGRDGTMPDSLYDDFRDTGLAHIVAVSGANITLLTALTFLAMSRLVGRRWAVAPALLAVVAYVAVVGNDASIVRAGVMAAVYLGGVWLGRPQSSLAALAAAALLMAVHSPGIVTEAGFQLSVTATAGIIVFAPWITWGLAWLVARGGLGTLVPSLVPQAMALTLAASLATLPVQWVHFGQISLIGLLANVLVEPLFALAFWLSIVTAVAGIVWEPLGWTVGWLAWYPLAAIVWIAGTLADVPGAAVEVPRGSGTQALAAIALLAAPGWFAYRYLTPPAPRGTDGPTHLRTFSGLVGGGLLTLLVVQQSLLPLRGPGELVVQVLDVGQGDAILITTPHGERVLIDGGPSGIGLAGELGDAMPHWERTLNAVILTHADQDHIGGFPELLERFDAAAIYEPGIPNSTEAYRLYSEEAPQRSVLARGDALEFDGVRLDVLWPPEGYAPDPRNDGSLVMRLSYGATSMLLTGDIEGDVQRDLMAAGIAPVDILKVPHHGSKTSDMAFIESMAGGAAVISVGANNRYGHPAPETLAALDDVPLLRTDLHGRITLRSDGERFTLGTAR